MRTRMWALNGLEFMIFRYCLFEHFQSNLFAFGLFECRTLKNRKWQRLRQPQHSEPCINIKIDNLLFVFFAYKLFRWGSPMQITQLYRLCDSVNNTEWSRKCWEKVHVKRGHTKKSENRYVIRENKTIWHK